jgi:hypothetical protein
VASEEVYRARMVDTPPLGYCSDCLADNPDSRTEAMTMYDGFALCVMHNTQRAANMRMVTQRLSGR